MRVARNPRLLWLRYQQNRNGVNFDKLYLVREKRVIMNEETSSTMTVIKSLHEYEVRPRQDHRGVDLISDALPFGRLWYETPNHAIGYAMHSSRLHEAVIRVHD